MGGRSPPVGLRGSWAVGRHDEPFAIVFHGIGELSLRARKTLGNGPVAEEPKGRDVAALDALERLGARQPTLLDEVADTDIRESRGAELHRQIVVVGKAASVDLHHLRENVRHPYALEARGRERRDDDPSSRPEHAPDLPKGPWPVDEVDDQPENGALEPAVLERQRLGGRLLEGGLAGGIAARLPKHPLGRVDSPHPRAALGERGRQPAGSAADVEDASAEEVTFADEQLEERPPALVLRAQPVVLGGDETVVG